MKLGESSVKYFGQYFWTTYIQKIWTIFFASCMTFRDRIVRSIRILIFPDKI